MIALTMYDVTLTSALGSGVPWVNCIFCRASIRCAEGFGSNQGYLDHLFAEHNIMFEVEAILEKTFKRRWPQQSIDQVNRPMLDAYVQVDLQDFRPPDPPTRRDLSEQRTISEISRGTLDYLEPEVLIKTGYGANQDHSRNQKTVPKIVCEPLEPQEEILIDLADDDDDVTDKTKDSKVDHPGAFDQGNQSVNDACTLKVLELPWFAGCEYQCKVCNLVYFYVEDLRRHIRSTHCPLDEYLEKHKIFETKAQYSNCEICDKDVKRNFFSYRRHLRECHNMSLERYGSKFGPKPNLCKVEKKLLDPRLKSDGVVDMQRASEVLPANNLNHERRGCEAKAQEIKKAAHATHDTSEIQATTGPQGPRRKNFQRRDQATFDWSNQCKYECQICKTVFSTYQAVQKHIQNEHDITVANYTKKFGKLIQEKIKHTCTICQREILHTSWNLRRHFKLSHQMSTQTYFWTRIASKSESFDWKNGCTYSCGICSAKLTSLPGFNEHLKLQHGVEDFSEYVLSHGDPLTKAALFFCPVCQVSMNHDAEELNTHLSECHQGMPEEEIRDRYFANKAFLTWQQYQDVKGTSSLVELKPTRGKEKEYKKLKWDQTVTFCPTCPATFYGFSTANNHFTHKKISSSQAIRGPFHIHQCRICKRRLRCTKFHIKYHLRKKHSMTLPDYEHKYYDSLRDELSKAEAKTSVAVHPGYDANIMSEKTTDILRGPKSLRRSRHSSKGCDFVWNHHIFFCPACPAIFYSKTMVGLHLSKKKIKASNAIPGPVHIHKCKLCSKRVKCSYDNMKQHLKAKHAMTLPDYERKFYDSLRDELSQAESESWAVAHPGLDLNFPQGNGQKTKEDQVTNNQLTNDTSHSETDSFSPMIQDVHSIPEDELPDDAILDLV